MNKYLVSLVAMLSCSNAFAAVTVSIEKDFLELGLYASLTEEMFLFVGGDTDGWLGTGIGYRHDFNRDWRSDVYYEYSLYDDWLMNDEIGIDGVKTKSHLVDISATRYFQQISLKAGLTAEHIRNGFTWLTVDDVNKYSSYLLASYFLKHIYVSGKVEHYTANDQSDMIDFNQGRANMWELSLGSMRDVFNFYPYVKVSVFSPNGTYYGQSSSNISFSINGTFSF